MVDRETTRGEALRQPVPPLVAGVLARCPRCGDGRLFQNGLMLRSGCEGCGLGYAYIDTGDGPAVFAILILGFFTLGLALFVEFRYEPPVWVHVAMWGLLTPLLSFALLRFLKATLIALIWTNKAEEGRLSKD